MSLATAPTSDTLSKLTNDLKSKNEEVRQYSAQALKEYVMIMSKELEGPELKKFYGEVDGAVWALVRSADNQDKLSGAMIIDKLIGMEGDETTNVRFANYLRTLLPGDVQTMTMAAQALGKLAQQGTQYIEYELSRAIEWLTDKQEAKRHASLLVLAALVRHADVFVYPHVNAILDHIWIAFRDPKQLVREAAADALSAVLIIIADRDNQLNKGWYERIHEEALRGLRIASTESIHGSLLVFRELLLHAGMFMNVDNRYKETCETVIRYKDHRDGLVRRAVVSLIPDLAAYNPTVFASEYLDKSMQHLLSQLRKDKDRNPIKDKDRSIALLAIGKVALVARADMSPYLDEILVSVRDGLRQKSKNRLQSDTPIFQCISMLANAVGHALTRHLHELLDLMFASGLSEPLRQALTDLANCIPPLLPTIQDRLLNMLSLILSGQMYKPPGAPSNYRHPNSANSPVRTREQVQQGEPKDVGLIILALDTLGSFDFSGHVLNEFVRDCCIAYLEDDNPEVRRSAAQTCCRLFVRDPICFQTSAHAVQVVGEVLEKLLTVGIADPDFVIRQTVLASLDERFDRHLAQAENVRSLFIALNDEVLSIREYAITIIGRLSNYNPAYVMPSLRKTLIQLLTEIEYSTVPRNKEESARLLSLLVLASQRLVKPYVESIIKVLLPKARDPSPSVVSSVLGALGELARVGGEDLLPYMDQLMPLIIETLQDQSSSIKRSAALKTLGQLSGNTGYVIEPYIKYPQLLDILMSILKSEQSPAIRRETVKVLGILGALDPYRHKQMVIESVDETQVDKSQNSDVSLLMSGLGPSSEEYYPTVVINALLKILKDPSLTQLYQPATEAIMNMFQTLQLKMVPFLPVVMPVFLNIIQSGALANLDFYFKEMSSLVTIVKLHIRPYLPDLLQIVRDNWNHTRLQERIIGLVESIAIALDGEFKAYLPSLLPSLLVIFDTDVSERHEGSMKVLQAFVKFGTNIEEYMHLVIPVLVKTFERQDVPMQLRKQTIITIGILARKVNFSDHASRIIHPFARVLALPVPELRMVTMDSLCSLILQLGQDYVSFIPLVKKVLQRNRIHHTTYESLVYKLMKREALPSELPGFGDDRTNDITADVPQAKLPLNQLALQRVWDTQPRSTKDDWADWIRRLALEMLKSSPSHALLACLHIAGLYYPLAKELFNAAFVSCWVELYDQYQEELAKALHTALIAPTISPEIIQTLLNLAEFMEHDDKPLPIDIRTLGAYAAKCHAYAKALHYKELEFITEPSTNTIESLISINNHLQQPDAAAGILTYAQQNHDLELKESWYERLHRWDDALVGYQRKSLEDPSNMEHIMGQMRCLHALGEWENLSALAQQKWSLAGPEIRRTMASYAAAAAWGLGQWELLDDYITVMQEQSPDRAFFKAILALHRNQFAQAEEHINKTRDLLDTELTALVGESYNRAYATVVRVQMMAELEEIIAYKQFHDQPDRQATIRQTWMKRLKGCQRNVEVWQKILNVHAIVVSPAQDLEMRIKFMNLCRKSGRLKLAEKTMATLMGPETADMNFTAITQVTPPQIVYAKLKYMWATGVREHTLKCLRQFTERLASDLGLGTVDDVGIAMTGANQQNGDVLHYSRLLARCYLKQGEWQYALQDGWTHDSIEDILTAHLFATHLDKHWYKAWHAWALANYEVINFYEKNPPPMLANRNVDPGLQYVIPSVMGFFKSIALCKGNSLQDTLRLLTLWFKYGNRSDVSAALSDGFAAVSIDTWLQVIPQLIARIHAPSPNVHRLIHQLLADVGKEHPQALVYSLTVASKSPSLLRKNAALAIMEKMRLHSPLLVEQALLVSQELIRVAILWHEMWYEGLEEASRLYFGDRNIEGMLAQLEPLHQMLKRGPETLREISFNQAFGRDLNDAEDCCKRYQATRDINDLNQAWDIYYQVFRRIQRQLPQLSPLELPYVSPQLQGVRDLELAIPGTYKSGEPIVKIALFLPTLTVLTSKQRPRRLTIKGSDGREYGFLLKGHEDLRQDERVMQLFGLVNTLLTNDPETFKRYLGIQRYPVIPLSPNSGLIGWLPDTDTLHTLIRDFRESRKILLNIEHRIMLQMAPDYDNLTLMQKVEVFEYALNNTGGQDLYKLLWLKSRNSEAWLDRRTNYTRSLAVMSMVGYILGLGDRHPSNLMLDRHSGKIIHIDFGDCFEVAMHREKFPEQIPFRLTRMLTNAMEVSGIEGNFRTTCENVMRVLRDNKDSLMAVLEAFVYDPLINWRILTTSPRQPTENGQRNTHQATVGTNETVIDEQARRRTMAGEREMKVDHQQPEQLNQRAVSIINRVTNKLTGRDFKPDRPLDVPSQVEKLIQQATSFENLCGCWVGWCAFW